MFRKLFLTGLFLLAVIASSSGSGIMFQKERVDAIVYASDTLEIRGMYWFVNEDNAPISAAIYYPFPIDSFSEYPHYITLHHLPDKQPFRFDKLTEGIQWNMTLAANTIDSFYVVYRQRVGRRQGRYIVTTAKLWGRPLVKAYFSVTMPPKLLLDFWSFPYDSIDNHLDTIVYHFHRSPFSPDADMLMKWRRK